jgi:hypothetical protein
MMERERSQRAEGEQGRVKTHDERYAFRGYYDREPGGECRVRILQAPDKPPILIVTELPENRTTSVTNLMETLAPELIGRHLPHRYEVLDEEPAIVIEHYPPVQDPRGRVREKATYDRVTFANWHPRKVWLHGQERLSLGEPEWHHLPDDEVRSLLGDEADDLPQQARASGTLTASDPFPQPARASRNPEDA